MGTGNDRKQQDDIQTQIDVLLIELKNLYIAEYTAWRLGATIEYYSDLGPAASRWKPVGRYGSPYGRELTLLTDVFEGPPEGCTKDRYLIRLLAVKKFVDPVTKRRYRIKGGSYEI